MPLSPCEYLLVQRKRLVCLHLGISESRQAVSEVGVIRTLRGGGHTFVESVESSHVHLQYPDCPGGRALERYFPATAGIVGHGSSACDSADVRTHAAFSAFWWKLVFDIALFPCNSISEHCVLI